MVASRRWSSDGLLQVAVADCRRKLEAAFDETVVHLVVETYERVGVEFGVSGLEIDEVGDRPALRRDVRSLAGWIPGRLGDAVRTAAAVEILALPAGVGQGVMLIGDSWDAGWRGV